MLSWLLHEPRGAEMARLLGQAELTLCSRLTPLECDRAFARLLAGARASPDRVEQARALLDATLGHWMVFDIDSAVVSRARQSFPCEPVRSLDAIHLATALHIRALVPDLHVLSLDDRLRASARELGLALLPE